MNKTIQWYSSVFWMNSLLLKISHPRGFEIINHFALSGPQGCVQLLLCFLFRLNTSHPPYNTCIIFYTFSFYCHRLFSVYVDWLFYGHYVHYWQLWQLSDRQGFSWLCHLVATCWCGRFTVHQYCCATEKLLPITKKCIIK